MVEKVIRTPYGVQIKDKYADHIYAEIRAIVITEKKEIDLWSTGFISSCDRVTDKTYTALVPAGEQYFAKGDF